MTASPAASPAASPDVRSSVVILALSVGGFAIGTVEFAAMSLVPYFAADLHVTPALASRAISAYALGVVIGAPLLAILGARASRRSMLIGLMLFYCLMNTLTAFAASFPQLLVLRFLAGLPHGAYFGLASLVAAGLVPMHRRARAVSMVMLGLTVATIFGVPAASLIGQYLTWRVGFGFEGGLAGITAVLLLLFAPADKPDRRAHPLQELAVLRNPLVLMILATGAIGFGGVFAVYTYVANTLQSVTHAPGWAEPMMFMIFGAGNFVGTFLTGRIADRGLLQTAAGLLLLGIVTLLIYPFTVHDLRLMAPCTFLIGFSAALGLPFQTYLMDIAGRAQNFAAALNQAAFNTANALGPFLASIAIGFGANYGQTGFVGAALSAIGLLLLAITWRLSRPKRWHGSRRR